MACMSSCHGEGWGSNPPLSAMEKSTEIGIGPVLKTGHRSDLVCEFESHLLRQKIKFPLSSAGLAKA